MKKVWMATDCVLSPLGSTTEENFSSIQKGRTGIHQIHEVALSAVPFFASSTLPLN
ncbi:MAG: hypothetical protein ABI663_17885 [Chryseolinea sp.]